MKKHFVTFLSPGTFVSEETTRPIESWDVAVAAKMARSIVERHAATPYCFFFTTRERSDSDLDSREIARSGRYFLGGKIQTISEIRDRQFHGENMGCLAANMEINRWEKVIENNNSYQTFQPFLPDDVLLDWKKEEAA